VIGVLCRDSEKEVAREFFQLFKTPWEFYTEGRDYQVVISSLYDTPVIDANLLIFYYSLPSLFDSQIGLFVESSVSGRIPCPDGTYLPIYRGLANLRGAGNPLICNNATGEIPAIQITEGTRQLLRVGYDLFQEVAMLLYEGQPAENAQIPTIELHISLLRKFIVCSGIPLIEIPPIPWGYTFITCLSHDVDFAGIRYHKFDHTMYGFIYRGTIASLLAFIRRKYTFSKLIKNWTAVLSLPLVYAGFISDFWDEFDRYATVDKDYLSTFFIIPFKGVTGEMVKNKDGDKRLTRYDILDIQNQVTNLISKGFEIGLHGIDAWHSTEKARSELSRITSITGQTIIGVRIHWLCFEKRSPAVLEQAGFDYDSTIGYNGAIGFKAGTTQVFLPYGASSLLELPLHIQDTALFFPHRMALTDSQAMDLCNNLINTVYHYGGVLTVLWHMRSLSPERLWDKFYSQLLREIKAKNTWFATAGQVVNWFRQRRSIQFVDSRFINGKLQVKLKFEGLIIEPKMALRIYNPKGIKNSNLSINESYIEFPYNGNPYLEIDFN
jgi:hypothetical protein